MIIFRVAEQKHGWSIRLGQGTSTHFRSRDLAIREANQLAENLRRHGASTRVIVQDLDTPDHPVRVDFQSGDRRRYSALMPT